MNKMNKKAHILIPTVLIKEAKYVMLNPVHSGLTTGAAGGILGGALGLGSQYLTERGRKKSFKEKLIDSIAPAAVGAVGGGLYGSVVADYIRDHFVNNLVADDILRASKGKTVIDNAFNPGMKEALTDYYQKLTKSTPMNDYDFMEMAIDSSKIVDSYKKPVAEILNNNVNAGKEVTKGFLDKIFGN